MIILFSNPVYIFRTPFLTFSNRCNICAKKFSGNTERLSRDISYALRHNPEACGLNMDDKGFVALDSLMKYLNSKAKWANVCVQDIIDLIKTSSKKRFQIKDGAIRAYYGHSCPQRIRKDIAIPPKILYHGTSHNAVEHILREGLSPQSRQYVHLSSTPDIARSVGLRRDTNPVIFRVDTENARKNGIPFYNGNEDVWLSGKIPPEFIGIDR